MPHSSDLYSLKYFFHTFWYLLRPATIESLINSTEGCNVFARISWLLCVLYQPNLLLCPVGVVARLYDWLYMFVMETENATIAIYGLWLSTNANFVRNFFEVYFTEYSENGETFSSLSLLLLAPQQILQIKAINKVKNINYLNFFKFFRSVNLFSNSYWNFSQ